MQETSHIKIIATSFNSRNGLSARAGGLAQTEATPLRTAGDSRLARSSVASEDEQVWPMSRCSDSLRSGKLTRLTPHAQERGLDKYSPGPRLRSARRSKSVPGRRQILLLRCKAAGEKSRRAERHTLKGNKAKLILTDGEYLNIYHLGAGIHVAVFQLRSIELALQGCLMMNKSEMRE